MMLKPRYILHSCTDLAALTQAAADFWLEQAEQAIALRGAFHVALTGGATPQPLYRLLASPERANRIDWSAVHIYIGDERYVPHDHPDSNYGMAMDCLLQHINIPAENLHPVPTDDAQAEQAAARYAAELAQQVPTNAAALPQFDLIMLGMGDDGHTASLFPDTDILQEQNKTVAAVYVDKLASWRVSMTYPCLNQARQIMVLISGDKKAGILAHIMKEGSEAIYPIQGVKPLGEMHWFVDQAAASLIAVA